MSGHNPIAIARIINYPRFFLCVASVFGLPMFSFVGGYLMGKCWVLSCVVCVLLGVTGCNPEPLFDTDDKPSGSMTGGEEPGSGETRVSRVRATVVPSSDGDVPSATAETEEEPTADSSGAGGSQVASGWPSAARNYYTLEVRLNELMSSVVDADSALAAVGPLQRLTAETRGTTKALWLWVATAPNDQVSRVLHEKSEVFTAQFPDRNNDLHERVIEIAKQPGNEAFRAAVVRFYEQMISESPPTAGGKLSQMIQPLR